MCGRFTLQTPSETIASMFFELRFPNLSPRYNIAPTQQVTCIRNSPSNQHEVAQLRWGLVPSWSRDLKIGARMINARGETVADKPSFRTPFKRRRCLVLADGFYEWKKMGKEKQPYYITLHDHRPFAMAGLWDTWKDKSDPESERVETCTVITTQANEMMQPLHDRMPVILNQESEGAWLSNEDDEGFLSSLLLPYPDGVLEHYEVSKLVNTAKNQGKEIIEPLSAL